MNDLIPRRYIVNCVCKGSGSDCINSQMVWVVTYIIHKDIYTHIGRERNNANVAKCQHLANLEKFREFVALFSQLFCYIFFQIKSFERCPSAESKSSSSHISEGGAHTLGNYLVQFLPLFPFLGPYLHRLVSPE